MKSKYQVIHWALALGVALVPAALCRAQAQPQTSAPTEVARLNDPAQPSPPAALGTTATDAPKTAARPADPAATPAILDELDSMKKRIAELESELAGRPAAAPSAESTSSPAATPAAASAAPQAAQGNAPLGLQEPPATSGTDNVTPFAYADFSWLNGNSREKSPVFDTNFFTPEIRFDSYYAQSFNQPKDHTLGGSSEIFRSGEFQVEQASLGGDFHWNNVRGRILTMFGMFGATTPRNDASAGVGSWDVRTAYRYVSEAYGGYHFNVNHGLNVDAGIFVSYIGLFSYYNFDNWTYQPSYVSSNTPWFFNGLRIQWFPTNKLKIEPWIINGWQSYNKFNGPLGLGGQILYRPAEWLSFVFNNYGMGTDTLNNPGRSRIHTDDSVEVRYYNHPNSSGITKMALSFTGDLGCEYGGGVSCFGGSGKAPKQAFIGWMLYDRYWFGHDHHAITLGGGQMTNPGRYLTLLPPINGADAISGSPFFTANPGDKAHMWDLSLNYQWMPKDWMTWWVETGLRHSDVPYWSGKNGITPPGGNTGSAASYVCTNGAVSGVSDFSPSGSGFAVDNVGNAISNSCTAQFGAGWTAWQPDLRRSEGTMGFGILVRF